MSTPPKSMDRRQFLGKAAAATAGLTIVRASAVAGTQANSAIEVGLIGSGRRGCWIGNHFLQNGNYRFVAAADLFNDSLENARKELNVPADRCYKGLEAYKELVAGKMDAVAIMSPPYCHPEQALAAAQAGKHVYLAKPVATDAPGCKTIEQAGQKAKAANRSFLVDFQTRSTPLFQEAAKRVHDGAIGEAICGQVYYHTGVIPYKVKPDPANPETRMRNWLSDKALSGDIIVEQNIHATDVADWFLGGHPLKAYGTGGTKGRRWGTCWSHFAITYWYPNDVTVNFSSHQIGVRSYQDICTRIYGLEGTVDSHYRGVIAITGKHPFPGGEALETFTDGAIANIKTFEKSLRTNKRVNNADHGAQSTLTAVLGRTAAYQNRVVTWDELIQANERLDPDVKL